MRRHLLIACLGLGACVSPPRFEPVGGFELVPAPERATWGEMRPHELEELLSKARARLVDVADYSARLETRERIEDALFPRRVMAVLLRVHPFSVAVETSEPPSEKGQRVWFDESANKGKLIAETPGFLGRLVGRVSLDPEGDLALENRRHPITDIGLARLIEQVEEGIGPALRRRGAPRIRAVETPHADGALQLVEALVPSEPPDPPLCTRLGFDRESGLLVYYGRAELLADGPALIEEYLYLDVEPNLGLADDAFRPAR